MTDMGIFRTTNLRIDVVNRVLDSAGPVPVAAAA
jgi:hypothetical protein